MQEIWPYVLHSNRSTEYSDKANIKTTNIKWVLNSILMFSSLDIIITLVLSVPIYFHEKNY